MSGDWREEVYHQEEESRYWQDGRCTLYWNKIRNGILKDDNYTCQRCGKNNIDDLTIHHVLPRALGGGDNPENLITLCNRCHDEVELLGFRSKWEITNVFDGESIEDNREETDKWQGWVYGARRRPKR